MFALLALAVIFAVIVIGALSIWAVVRRPIAAGIGAVVGSIIGTIFAASSYGRPTMRVVNPWGIGGPEVLVPYNPRDGIVVIILAGIVGAFVFALVSAILTRQKRHPDAP